MALQYSSPSWHPIIRPFRIASCRCENLCTREIISLCHRRAEFVCTFLYFSHIQIRNLALNIFCVCWQCSLTLTIIVICMLISVSLRHMYLLNKAYLLPLYTELFSLNACVRKIFALPVFSQKVARSVVDSDSNKILRTGVLVFSSYRTFLPYHLLPFSFARCTSLLLLSPRLHGILKQDFHNPGYHLWQCVIKTTKWVFMPEFSLLSLRRSWNS